MDHPLHHHLGRVGRLRRIAERERMPSPNAVRPLRLNLLLLRAQRLLAAVVSPSPALRPVPARVPTAGAEFHRRLS